MLFEYIQAAISKAVYEVVDDEEPCYGEVPDPKGVWAIGKTREECRENLRMAMEDGIAFSLRFNLPILVIESQAIKAPVKAEASPGYSQDSQNINLIRCHAALGIHPG